MDIEKSVFKEYCDVCFSSNDEYIDIGIDWFVHGCYIPSRWGYSGADPDEFPEVEAETIVNLLTGESIDEKSLPPKWLEQQREKLLEEVMENLQEEEEEKEER